jgi:hypothetical protein
MYLMYLLEMESGESSNFLAGYGEPIPSLPTLCQHQPQQNACYYSAKDL